ncbi:MAG: spore cortex biosynthesis protein YabQ [Clostridia bacterium]|nr:spore cortex biosynthesis protein YabQ [Clostridia bacterium]
MWEINLSNQIISFFLSICLGAILCGCYDFIRAIRKIGFNSFFTVLLVDILFSVVSAFATFIFLIARTNGEIRGFVLFGELLGFFVFRFTFSNFLFKIFLFLLKKINNLLNKLNDIIIQSYVFFEKLSKKFLLYFFAILKRVKKGLKNVSKVLYTNNNNVIMENDASETKTQT